MSQKINKIPPLDECQWMKNDVLLANFTVIKQDMSAKVSNIVDCLKSFNDLYDLHRVAVADVYVDPIKKIEKVVEENLQVLNTEDFDRIIQEIIHLQEDAREDNLTCAQLLSDSQDRGDFYRNKNLLLPIASKYDQSGIHLSMDEAWIRWIRNLLHSTQVWSDILAQRLSKCLALFEEVSEIIFLSDKAFPFILDTITKLAQANKQQNVRLDDQLAQWKDLSQFLKGMELRLVHLKAKLSSKWQEGSKEVGVLLDDVFRLKKMVSFLWGEASATRIYARLVAQIQEIVKSILKLQGEKNVNFNRINLTSLAEKVFNIVVAED